MIQKPQDKDDQHKARIINGRLRPPTAQEIQAAEDRGYRETVGRILSLAMERLEAKDAARDAAAALAAAASGHEKTAPVLQD